MRTVALTKICNRNKVYYGRYSVVSIEKWISIWQLVPVLFRVSRSPGGKNKDNHIEQSTIVILTMVQDLTFVFFSYFRFVGSAGASVESDSHRSLVWSIRIPRHNIAIRKSVRHSYGDVFHATKALSWLQIRAQGNYLFIYLFI